MKIIYDTYQRSHSIKAAYESGLYIVAYRTVYQPHYSENSSSYYAREVYRHSGEIPLTKRGRYFHQTAAQVNRMIDMQLLAEL